jgi:hypothetical protein
VYLSSLTYPRRIQFRAQPNRPVPIKSNKKQNKSNRVIRSHSELSPHFGRVAFLLRFPPSLFFRSFSFSFFLFHFRSLPIRVSFAFAFRLSLSGDRERERRVAASSNVYTGLMSLTFPVLALELERPPKHPPDHPPKAKRESTLAPFTAGRHREQFLCMRRAANLVLPHISLFHRPYSARYTVRGGHRLRSPRY